MSMDNYQYCQKWAVENLSDPKGRVLDYGCGAGLIVFGLRQKNVEAFGCDMFYEGGDYSPEIPSKSLGAVIKRIGTDGKIPFDDQYFDIVLSNQVFEHVEDMDFVLEKISRVLKPGGKMLSLFPDKSVWREGHSGIPFLHWFSKGSRLRIKYALVLRCLGCGYFKQKKSPLTWCEDICLWLDKWTYYRPLSEIMQHFKRYFKSITPIEDHWLKERLGRKSAILRVIPRRFQCVFVRKMGGLVLVCQKDS